MTELEAKIPISTLVALRRYKDHHHTVGPFLYEVLSNNLVKSILRADDANLKALPTIVKWCMDEMPTIAWHTKDKVDSWLANESTYKCEGSPNYD